MQLGIYAIVYSVLYEHNTISCRLVILSKRQNFNVMFVSIQGNCFSGFVTTCQVSLRRENALFIQAARDFVENHDTVVRYLREATTDVEKGSQRVSIAKILGNAILVVGDIPAIIGGVFLATDDYNLLLPPGLVLLIIAVVLQFVGGITTIIALIGDAVYNRKVRERTNKWIRDVNAHRDHVIQAHAEYLELCNQISEEYNCSNDEVIQISLAYTFNKEDQKFDLPEFLAGNPKDKITTREMAKVLESGMQIIGISLVWLLCLAGIICIAQAPENIDVSCQVGILGYLSSIFATIFSLVIVGFICKTGYSIYRSDKGTQLSRKLQATAQTLELEAEELHPLSVFVIPHICTPATCKELRNEIDQHLQAIDTLTQHWDAGVEYFRNKAINVCTTVRWIGGLKLAGIAIASLADIVKIIVGMYILLSHGSRLNSNEFWLNPGVLIIMICSTLECLVSFVALCAIVADVVTRSKTLKHSNKWIDNSIILRRHLLRRHEGYCEELNSVKQSVNADVHQAVFGKNYERPDSIARELLRTDHTARVTIKWRWWKILEFGIQIVMFLLGGPFIYLWIIRPGTDFHPNSILPSLGLASIVLGVLFVLVNIPILLKIIHDLSTMELHRKVQDVTRSLTEELEELRNLASFAVADRDGT